MPTEVLNTDGSLTPITLSVNEVFGHRITTIISIDGVELITIQDNFNDHLIGNNTTLAGKRVDALTTSLKVTPTNNTETDYSLKGCGGAGNQTDDTDPLTFDPGSNLQTHSMTYFLA